MLPSIGDPSPVVASQPFPAENPITLTGLPIESNSSAELLPLVDVVKRNRIRLVYPADLIDGRVKKSQPPSSLLIRNCRQSGPLRRSAACATKQESSSALIHKKLDKYSMKDSCTVGDIWNAPAHPVWKRAFWYGG